MAYLALSDRALLTVSGKDAEGLLQSLITTDLDQLKPGQAQPGALLTPQGKIMFDFLISRDGEALRIEIDAAHADAFLKRLTMYKLRAVVEITLISPAPVTVGFGEDVRAGIADGRFEKAGATLYRIYADHPADTASAADYDALRIAAGVAVSGADYALQDAFPHDVLMDKNGGLSFKKGCYVGQEVVSRMQHRGTARRRIVLVQAETALPDSGTSLTVDGRTIGALGSVSGGHGLAIVRIDKAGDAMTKGLAILAGETPVTLTLPGWSGLSFPTEADEASA